MDTVQFRNYFIETKYYQMSELIDVLN